MPSVKNATAAMLLAVIGLVLVPVRTEVRAATSQHGAEQESACLVNSHRSSFGASALRIHPELTRVAREHSARMAASGQLFHNSSLGSNVTGWRVLAENVGRGPSVRSIHSARVQSVGHRAKVENGRVPETGVGVVIRSGTVWITQIFRQPVGATSGSLPSCAVATPLSSTARVGPRSPMMGVSVVSVPVVGDWNADGRTTVGFRRPGGYWSLRNRHAAGTGDERFSFGLQSQDEGFVGDWNGDGRTSVGVRRDNRWLLRDPHTAGTATYTHHFG